jgi:ATP-dependent Clp protease ATP-binding subunit ClpC
MQEPNLTPEYQECIAHAWLYTISRNQSMIGHDEMLLWLYHHTQQQAYHDALWEIVGIRKSDWLQEYISTSYTDSPLQVLQGNHHQLMIEHSLQQSLFAGEQNSVVELLNLSWKGISDQFKAYLKSKKVPYQKVSKRIWLLNDLLDELEISIEDLMIQFQAIKDQYDVKLYDIDLDFLLNDEWEDDEMTALIQQMIGLGNESPLSGIHSYSDYDIINSDDTDLMDRDDEDDTDGKSTSAVAGQEDTTTKKKKLAVDHFGIDMTNLVRTTTVDPVIGRDKETDQVIYTLLRKTKNNPLLIGEAWVGKTAIIEWLAQRIVAGMVPDKLLDKRLIMLDMSTLVAGTKYRGEFESRLKSILDEASDPTLGIILFIDEIHTLMGAGSAEGTAGDAAQMLKPMLARGQIKVIGATTFDEYQKHIEKDAALKRRFQEVNVWEPNHDDTIAIITGLKTRYEDFHGVSIDTEAIEQAVTLSKRYILTKHLPDKAIDLIDEACARKAIIKLDESSSQNYKALTDESAAIDAKIEQAVADQDYFAAAELKKQQNEVKLKLQEIKWTSNTPRHLRPIITPADINNVIADKIGIPTHMISESEVDKLRRLDADLTMSLHWQEEVVQLVTKAIKRSRLSVVHKSKPIASFLFLWPSGVGKTFTAKLIAKDYFNDEKALIRVDMSDLMERHSVSKLIGSAPWYVGYDEWGGLTEQVRRKPYSVILFDEIEKASPDVLNIMLQILDEWQIKDNKGRLIDFKNTIIIMTSNLWSEFFTDKGTKIGFGVSGSADFDYDHAKSLVMDKVNSHFTPEWLNRIDFKIVFRPLSKIVLADIFRKHLNGLFDQRRAKSDITLPEYSDDRVATIINDIYNPAYGARPVEQYIFDKVEEELIEQVMNK